VQARQARAEGPLAQSTLRPSEEPQTSILNLNGSPSLISPHRTLSEAAPSASAERPVNSASRATTWHVERASRTAGSSSSKFPRTTSTTGPVPFAVPALPPFPTPGASAGADSCAVPAALPMRAPALPLAFFSSRPSAAAWLDG